MSRYGYIRVSTSEQVRGTSLDEQEAKIRWIADGGNGVTIDEVFSDGAVSGSTALRERPAGGNLMEKVKTGDTIYVAKLDRIFRSAADALVMAEEFTKRGIDLVIADIGAEPVTKNGTSRMFFNILACVADFERSRIMERITSGKDAKKAQGGYIGGRRPFGYQISGTGKDAVLVPDREEQKALLQMQELRKSGFSYTGIASAMRDLGVKVSHAGVKKILDRERASSCL